MPNDNDNDTKKRAKDVNSDKEELPAEKKAAVAKDDHLEEVMPEQASTTEPPTVPTEHDTAEELALRFPSLKESLESSTITPILALYFASSWCPDCTGVTPKLQEICSYSKDNNNNNNQQLFDLIYVSSDYTEEQCKGNLPSSADCWGCVPFDRVEERSNLKRHFGACAAKEMSDLGMTSEDRKSGIPTLILIDKRTGKMLTRDAVDDIEGERGSEAILQKWKEML
jgi:nucleoredoxin